MKLMEIAADAASAIDGDWIDDLPGMGDFAVFTRSLECPAARAFRNELSRSLGRKLRSRKSADIPPEVNDYLLAKTLIEVCVDDWKNLDLPVDVGGRLTFNRASIVGEKALAFSKDLLAAILLEPAPEGEIRTQATPGQKSQTFKTPDGNQVRFAMRDFLSILVIASDRAAAPAEADDDGNVAAQEKNSSAPGSPGKEAKPAKTQN